MEFAEIFLPSLSLFFFLSLFFLYFLHLYCSILICPVGSLCCFPWGERESHATQPTVPDGYFIVFIIHWTLTWTTGCLTCTQMLTHAIAKGDVWAPWGSLHWKLTLGENSLAAPGNRTCVSGVPVQWSTNWATAPHLLTFFIPLYRICWPTVWRIWLRCGTRSSSSVRSARSGSHSWTASSRLWKMSACVGWVTCVSDWLTELLLHKDRG